MLAERDPAALMVLLPADHVVLLRDAFEEAVGVAAEAAQSGKFVLFGISARTPETGFGYIARGDVLGESGKCFRVSAFFEKPDLATAESYVASGRHYWNSGMFLFRADAYLPELERLEPEMLAACWASLAASRRDLDFLRLDEAAFGCSPSRSIDYAVMEHTPHAAVVPVDLGWNDVGSWLSLWEIGDKDADGNVMRGDVIAHATRNSYPQRGPSRGSSRHRGCIRCCNGGCGPRHDAFVVAGRQTYRRGIAASRARIASQSSPRVPALGFL
jgi:mannose-1-phosphate guanylyltransferase/mannose-6-phosphate isomerase